MVAETAAGSASLSLSGAFRQADWLVAAIAACLVDHSASRREQPTDGTDDGAVFAWRNDNAGAGCVVNDMWDRRIDLRVERTRGRPLAAGTVSLLQALLFLAILCLIGLGILMQLPQTAIMVGIASLPLIIIYPLAKRVTWWPQAVLGLTFSWGIPLGWAAVTDQWPTPEIWLIYAGSVAWVFGYDTIYAVQDMADDRIAGVKSSALGLGDRLNLGVRIAFCVAILLISAGIQAHQGPGVWMLGVVLMALHLLRQARMINPDDPQGALTLFKSNRNAGLILTLFLIVDRRCLADAGQT